MRIFLLTSIATLGFARADLAPGPNGTCWRTDARPVGLSDGPSADGLRQQQQQLSSAGFAWRVGKPLHQERWSSTSTGRCRQASKQGGPAVSPTSNHPQPFAQSPLSGGGSSWMPVNAKGEATSVITRPDRVNVSGRCSGQVGTALVARTGTVEAVPSHEPDVSACVVDPQALWGSHIAVTAAGMLRLADGDGPDRGRGGFGDNERSYEQS